jgi:3-oxoacyl-(acyl-carrier-protein) synthase
MPGTSAVLADAASQAIKQVFGSGVPHPDQRDQVMLGHCLTAAGLDWSLLVQMGDGICRRSASTTSRPGFGLDFVPHHARRYDIESRVNSFGFGGLNACVVVGRA